MKKEMTKLMICACTALMVIPAVAQQETIWVAGDDVAVKNMSVARSGENLVVDMDVNLDNLNLPSNMRLVFTPVVQGGGHSKLMPPVVVNGKKQQISYDRYGHKDYAEKTLAVRRRNKTGQTVHYTGSLPYETWMENANVALAEDLCGCGDVFDQQSTVLERMRHYDMVYVRPKAEARKERHEKGRAFLDFPVDKITLYPDYRNNPRELDKIFRTINVVREDKNATITNISIHGYASPESPYEHNAYLAENRARTLKEYVARLTDLDESLFKVEHTPEDWDGLRNYVTEGNLTHKSEVLALIDDESLDPDSKEWKIKLQYPEDYRFMLSAWYPALRHSDYEVSYYIRPFSVDEAKALLHTKPQQLSLEEMFMVAQTYEPGSAEFDEVFAIAVRMYPDDPTANLNVACTLVEAGDYARAQPYLDKAGNVPEALYVRGVVAAKQGRTAEARGLWKQAAGAGLQQASRSLDLMDME